MTNIKKTEGSEPEPVQSKSGLNSHSRPSRNTQLRFGFQTKLKKKNKSKKTLLAVTHRKERLVYSWRDGNEHSNWVLWV